jgi:CBS-domain-containing membrane protein
MNAAEIVTKEVITVRLDTTVGAVLRLGRKISAVPGIDDDRHVVGIVSEGDLRGQPRARGGCDSSTKVRSVSKKSQQPGI